MTITGDTHDDEDEAEDEAEPKTKQTRLTDLDPRDLRSQTDVAEVKECLDGSYNVISRSSGNVYNVTLDPVECECPDFQYREEVDECKHIRAVFGRRVEAEDDDEPQRELVAEQAREYIDECKHRHGDMPEPEQVVEQLEARLKYQFDTVEVTLKEEEPHPVPTDGTMNDYECLAAHVDAVAIVSVDGEPVITDGIRVDLHKHSDWELVDDLDY